MSRVYLNNVSTKLTAQLLTGGVTASVTAGDGASFAGATGGNYIVATLVRVSGFKEIAREIVHVTAQATDDLTVTRAQEGTTALQFEVGDVLSVRATKASFDEKAEVAGLATQDFATKNLAVAGYHTAALQPLFSAYRSADVLNVAGDGTVYTLICDTEITDRASNYNNTTGVFTAPVEGQYLFTGVIGLTGIISTHTLHNIALVTSNRTYNISLANTYVAASASGSLTVPFSIMADMDVSDTAYVTVAVYYGTKVVDVTATTNKFQGVLLA